MSLVEAHLCYHGERDRPSVELARTLRLLKADDMLLRKLLKEGVLPPLLGILSSAAAESAAPAGDVDDAIGAATPSPVAQSDSGARREGCEGQGCEDEDEREGEDMEEVRAAETTAAAARAIEAFASSGDALTTLLRGGATEALSRYLCRAGGEVLVDSGGAVSGGGSGGGGGGGGSVATTGASATVATASAAARERAAVARVAAAQSCVTALSRISKSYLASTSAMEVGEELWCFAKKN